MSPQMPSNANFQSLSYQLNVMLQGLNSFSLLELAG